MVDLILRRKSLAEARARFVNEALAAEAETVASGKAYPAAGVHDFVVAKASKRKVARPKAKAWR